MQSICSTRADSISVAFLRSTAETNLVKSLAAAHRTKSTVDCWALLWQEGPYTALKKQRREMFTQNIIWVFTPIMENQMEKKMENEMETGV